MKKITLTTLVAVSAMLAACSSTPVSEPAPEAKAEAPAPTPAPAPAAPVAAAPVAAVQIPQQRSVYFDFDMFNIKPEFNSQLEQHAAYLKANPGAHIRLEGNADERGSREYNLALGQKRSESVKRALSTLGAGAGQQEAVSNGEEKPKASGHDEKSWSENRRVDIIYTKN